MKPVMSQRRRRRLREGIKVGILLAKGVQLLTHLVVYLHIMV